MNKFRNENNNRAINWGRVLGTTESGVVYPTDVDGMLERCGHFLVLEWKHHSVHIIPQGQDIMFKRLAELPEFTCLYLFGDYDTWRIHAVQKLGQHEQRIPSSNEEFLSFMRRWWQMASNTVSSRTQVRAHQS